MTRPSTKVLAITACGLLAVTMLGACSDSAETVPTVAPTVAASALAEPTVEATEDVMVGEDPATWSPIIIKKKKSIEIIPKQVALFPNFEYGKKTKYVAVSSDPAIIEVLPADNASVVAFRGLAPGTAVVKVYDGPVDGKGKVIQKVKVTVNPS